MNVKEQKLLLEFQTLQQKAQQLNSQLEAIDKQIREIEEINTSIERINKKQDNEILAGLGKGIFVRTKVLDNKLFVNVGSGIVIRRTAKETSEIIKKQTERLEEMKKRTSLEMIKLNSEMQNIAENLS